MIRPLIRHGVFTMCLLASAQAYAADDVRVTVGVPVYVNHPDSRSGGREWNEGWFHNEGALVDVTWPVMPMGKQTNLRLGVTGGGFDNSLGRSSFFVGGVGEVESFVTKDWALSVGAAAGAATGYERNIAPMVAPYVGTSYALTNSLEVGARGLWLPGKTLGGTSVSDSDAYVGIVTLGTRF